MQDFATGKAAFSKALRQLTCFFEKNRKAVRIMKITGILILAACLQVSAKGITQTVTISLKDAPLLTVLQEIERQTGYSFFAETIELQKAKKVSVTAKNLPLQQVLDICFKGQPLTYKIVDKVINILPRMEKASMDKSLYQSPPEDIRGKIINENGEPVLATVTVKGTSMGANTNDNGEFQLSGVPDNAVLVISGVGLETKEQKINGQQFLNILVKTSVSQLQETVIKGYYTTTRTLNTGNVSKVKGQEIKQQPVSNVLFALEGKVPGLFIAQAAGTPGSYATVRLRGQSSIANGNDPLYIIDGVPFTSTPLSQINLAGVNSSPLNSINPNDIESIEVLKDADATAIYGSRGANGVILITTRNGKAGKTRVDLNFYQGFGEATRVMDLLNTQQYLQMRHEAFQNDGVSPSASDYDINGKWDTTKYTDWQKVFLGNTASITNADISVSGGNSNIKYLIGGSYHNEGTITPENFYARSGSAHFNLNGNSNNQKFNFSFTGNYVNGKRVLPASDLTYNILLPPNAPKLYSEDGSLNWENYTWNNPFALLRRQAKDYTDNLISSLSAGYKILPGLEIKASLNYNDYRLNESAITPLGSFRPIITNVNLRRSQFSTSEIKTWNVEPQINYNKSFGKSQLSLLLGSTFLQTNYTALNLLGIGFASDDLIDNLAAASSIIVQINNITNYKYNAFFARVGYNWDEKYILNLTARRDGSSRFGPDTRFGNFGAIGAGWVFSKENLIQRKFKFLSFGKLRASYGTTGNDQIGDYMFIPTYSSYSFSYQGLTGLTPTRLPNPHYGWEEQKKLEVGIEFGFLNNNILVNADFYRNRTDNQLVNYPLASLTGGSSVIANLPAVIENKGFEFELNTVNLKSKNVTWRSSFNISFPKNKLVSFPGIEKTSYATRYQVGKSLFVKGLFHLEGVDPQTGLYQLQDININGQLDYPGDLTFDKEVKQNYYGGFSNSLTYQNIQLDFLLQFVKQTGYNYYTLFQLPGSLLIPNNQPTGVLSRWQKVGDDTQIQKFSQDLSSSAYDAYTYTASYSDAQISNASFLRLKNISLSYQLSNNWKNKIHLQNAKIYVLGQNLFTVTNYLGLDPETQGLMPPLRTIVFGIQLTF